MHMMRANYSMKCEKEGGVLICYFIKCDFKYLMISSISLLSGQLSLYLPIGKKWETDILMVA